MIASAVSAVLPILQIIVLAICDYLLPNRDENDIEKAFERGSEDHDKNTGDWEIYYDKDGFPYAPGEILYSRRDADNDEALWVKEPMIHEMTGNFHIQLRLVIGRLADLKYRRHYSDTLYQWEKLKRMYESLRAHGFCIPLSSCPLPQEHYRVAPWQPLKSARDLEKDKDWEVPCAVVSNLLTHPEM
jgi:hypothetical protein